MAWIAILPIIGIVTTDIFDCSYNSDEGNDNDEAAGGVGGGAAYNDSAIFLDIEFGNNDDDDDHDHHDTVNSFYSDTLKHDHQNIHKYYIHYCINKNEYRLTNDICKYTQKT